MHVYCVANCGHTTASLLVLHPCNTTRYQNNLSLVGISRSNSFIFSLHSLSLSISLSPSLLEFICLTFNNIRIYVTTFGKHIKYERYLTHLWPERHVAHFMLFFPYRKQLCYSFQNIEKYLFALKDHL